MRDRRLLTSLLVVPLLGGCLGAGAPPSERRPPDAGPPVGGHAVIEWDGDAALDPRVGPPASDGGPEDSG